MYCACGNPIENKDTGLCASCNHAQRDAAKKANKVKVFKPIRKVSKKMAKDLRKYGLKKAAHLAKHPDCQVRLVGCQNNLKTNTVHHAAKRGKNLNNEETFLTACEYCHDQIEFVLSAKERREKGLLITTK